jgi:ketosteroid isomerase-like protein
MSMRFTCMTLLVAVSSWAQTAGSGIVCDRSPAAEVEVKTLELQLCDLLVRGDLDSYARHVADDYVRTGPDGSLAGKDEVLRALHKNRIVAMEPRDIRIRVYGDTAVLSVDLLWKQERGAGPVALRSRITKTFVKRAQGWILLALAEVNENLPSGTTIEPH